MLIKLQPHVCLAHVIDYYWIEKNSAGSVKVLPDGTTSILFNLGESLGISNGKDEKKLHLSHDLIIGAHKKYYTLFENPDTHIVGIKFKQGGAFHFFNVPQKDFSHQIINLHDVLNGESERLREQLIVPQEQDEIKRILDHYMLIKVGHSNKSSQLVNSIMSKVQVDDLSTIKDLSHDANISHKHLITLFNQIVGLPPKLIHRLNKFTKVLDIIQKNEKVHWPQVAYECHYYDQAHLINEFKTFSGLSPKKYFDHKNAHGLRVILA